MGMNGQEEASNAYSPTPRRILLVTSPSLSETLKGNKQAIGAFKSFLDTLANDNGDSGRDSNDENYFLLPTQPR
jgi:hypothetical protein